MKLFCALCSPGGEGSAPCSFQTLMHISPSIASIMTYSINHLDRVFCLFAVSAMEARVETAMSTSRHLCASTVTISCRLHFLLVPRCGVLWMCYTFYIDSGATCARLSVDKNSWIAHYCAFCCVLICCIICTCRSDSTYIP